MSDYVLIQAELESYMDQITKESHGDRPITQAVSFLSSLMDCHSMDKEEDFINFFDLMYSKYARNSQKEFLFDFLLKSACTFQLSKSQEVKSLVILPFITKTTNVGKNFEQSISQIEEILKKESFLKNDCSLIFYPKVLPFLTSASIWSFLKTRKIFKALMDGSDISDLISTDYSAFEEYEGTSSIGCLVGIVSYDSTKMEEPYAEFSQDPMVGFKHLEALSHQASSVIEPFIPLMELADFYSTRTNCNKTVREMLFQKEFSEKLKELNCVGADLYASNRITQLNDPAEGLEIYFFKKDTLSFAFDFKIFATSEESVKELKTFIDRQFDANQITWLDHRMLEDIQGNIQAGMVDKSKLN